MGVAELEDRARGESLGPWEPATQHRPLVAVTQVCGGAPRAPDGKSGTPVPRAHQRRACRVSQRQRGRRPQRDRSGRDRSAAGRQLPVANPERTRSLGRPRSPAGQASPAESADLAEVLGRSPAELAGGSACKYGSCAPVWRCRQESGPAAGGSCHSGGGRDGSAGGRRVGVQAGTGAAGHAWVRLGLRARTRRGPAPRRSGSAAGRRMGLPPPDRSLPAGQRCWPPPRQRGACRSWRCTRDRHSTAPSSITGPIRRSWVAGTSRAGYQLADSTGERGPNQLLQPTPGCELMSQPDPLSPARDHVHKYATMSSPTATHLGSRPAEPPPVPAWRPRGWHTLGSSGRAPSRRRNPGLPGLGRCRYRRPGLARRRVVPVLSWLTLRSCCGWRRLPSAPQAAPLRCFWSLRLSRCATP